MHACRNPTAKGKEKGLMQNKGRKGIANELQISFLSAWETEFPESYLSEEMLESTLTDEVFVR